MGICYSLPAMGNEEINVQPHPQRCPWRAIGLPLILDPTSPSIIIVLPCIGQKTLSSIQETGNPIKITPELPSRTIPP